MKILKLILVFYIIHSTFYITSAQYRQDRSIVRGNVTSITVKYPGDITADSLIFQVRTNSSYTSTKHIEKKNSVAGGSTAQISTSYTYPYTSVTVYFSSANTSGLSIANYYYDLRKSISPDSAVYVYGAFSILTAEGTVTNNGNIGGGLSENWIRNAISDTADVLRSELTDSLDAVRTLIGTGGVPLPDSVVYESELGYVNVKDYGAVGDSSTNDTQAFQDAINAGNKIYVPDGVYTVDSLVLKSGTILKGNGNSSKICLSDNDTILIKIKGESGYYSYEPGIAGVRVENLWLSGVDNSEIAGGYPSLGDRVGIYIDNATNTIISNCKITGFSLAGILSEKTNSGVTYTFNTNVSNCLIQSNYYGIWIKEQSEYGFYHNNLIQGYYEGVKLIGGNNAFSNNQIINGIIGLRLQVGVNDSHGSFTGGSINHNTIAIQADSIRTGFEISNINLWYGAIVFNYAREVRIMNSKVYSDSIVFKNGDCANSGFINCTFADDVSYITRDKGTDQSIMKNNNFFGTLNGLTDQEINDIEFTPTVLNVNSIPAVEYNKNLSSYTSIPTNDNINFGTKDFTIEWLGYLKPDGTYQYLVTKQNPSAPNSYVGYALALSSVNTIQLQVYGVSNNYTTGDSPEITEGFYHIIATKQDTNFAFYINGDSLDEYYGVLLTENPLYNSYDGSSTSSWDSLRIGAYSSSSYHYGGSINFVRLYNFGVSGTEAHNMYTEGQPQLSEVPYKYKWGSQDSLTSGTLELGKTYIIDDYVSGDDFTNIGGANSDSSIFIATGTTPTTWTNSSIVRKLGCVVEYRVEKSTETAWVDNSANGIDGTNHNVSINKTSYIIGLPDTASITTGYVPKKQADGTVLWQPDISTSGSGTFNPDGLTIDTTALGSARVIPTKVTKWDSVSVKLNKADSTIYLTPSDARAEFLQISDSTIYLTPSDANTAYQPKDTDLDNPDLALNLLQDSLDVKMNRSEMSGYATASHTHTNFFDTLTVSFGVMDTVTAGDYPGWKVPNNITITEISAYTNTGTVTFNLEERAETTPNTAGTDLMGSDLVADNDQQETGTFSNATLDRNDWLVMNVTSISGDPTIFGVTIRYVKTN